MHRLTGSLNARAQNRNFFSGAVFDPGIMPETVELPSSPEVPIQTVAATGPQEVTSLRNLVLNALIATSPTSEDLQEQRLKLIADASVGSIDLAATDEFISICREEKQSNWQREHIEVRRLGREQLATCERLTAEFNIVNGHWNSTQQAQVRAIDDIKAAKYRRERLGRFSSDQEIRAAEQRVAQAQVHASKVVEANSRALAARNLAEQLLSDARAELNRLGASEHQLRCLLEGRAYVDPTYGIVTAANGA